MLRIVARLSERAQRDAAQVAGDQRDVGRLDRHVGAGADRDPDIGLGERGGVVDPVADHRHQLALVLQMADLERLVLGQDLGEDALDADLARRSPRPCGGCRR